MHNINHYANQNYNEYHYAVTRMAEMKATDGQGCVAVILSCVAGEGVVVLPLWKTVCQFLLKPNVCLLCDPAIPRLDVYRERFENIYPHKHISTNVHSSSVQNSPKLKQF